MVDNSLMDMNKAVKIVVFIFCVSVAGMDLFATEKKKRDLPDRSSPKDKRAKPTDSMIEMERQKFCQKAPDFLKDLQTSEPVDRMKKVGELQKDIQSLQTQKNILLGVKKIRDEYLQAFQRLNQDPKNEYKDKISNFKKTLSHAFVLKSMSGIIKAKPEVLKKDFKFETLCTDNQFEELCKFQKENKSFFSFFQTEEISKSLSNFSEAYLAVEKDDQAALSPAINRVIESIPSNMSPDLVMSSLKKFSEETEKKFSTFKVNGQSFTGHVKNCMKDEAVVDDQSCKNLLSDDFINLLSENFKITPSKKENDSHKLNLIKTENAITESLMKNMQKSFTDIKEFNSSLPDKKIRFLDEAITSLNRNSNLNELLKKISDKMPESKAQVQMFEKFKADCAKEKFETMTTAIEKEKHIQNCDKMINEDLAKMIDPELSRIVAAISEKAEAMKALTGNKETKATDKMKLYLANRYLRICKAPESLQTEKVDLNPCGSSGQFETLSNLKIFSGSQFSIIGHLSKFEKGDGIFDKKEMREYIDLCEQNSSLKGKVASEVCQYIKSDYNEVQSSKTAEEWQDFHKKYYVVNNPRNPKGYDVYEKQSTWSLIGQSAPQIIGTGFSMLMQNMQFNYQLDALTNQAMMQKQWMFDMNYVNNFWMNNYFLPNLGSTPNGFNFTGSATQPGSTTIQGFNFN